MHPELKFMEHRTSDKIAAFLTELDIPYKRGLASTGIVGSIYGKNRSANDPGPALGIRADIDALPLEEANKFTHASKHKGCMHGCGHDGHTAMLLGAAELLSANRDFDGTIHLSWRHTFYFSFSLTLLPIVLIYFFTSNFPQENKYVNVLELQKINKSTTEEVLHKNSSEKISVVERAKVYLCNSNFWILLAVFSSNSMLSWGVVTWLPTYLNTERGFSWANVGWMSALPFIFGLLFKVLAGFIVDKTDRKGMVMFVSAMLCAASILTGVNISNNFFAAIVISFGIGASSMQLPCVFTLLQSMVPAEAMSSAAGALNGMAVGFGALSPVLIGFILSVTHNFYFVMYILIGIVVIGGLFSLLFSRDRSRLLN
ncbi:MFS transporter [Klebsiella sp. C228]|uniref:MFS transporter n=1 Tax=Klebsiella sp. C228 TaxID=3409926 RepID=UPI002AB7F6DE|nr:MFS transporter [Klebsiella pneumoniae]